MTSNPTSNYGRDDAPEAEMLLRHMSLPNVVATHYPNPRGWCVKLKDDPTDIGIQTFLVALLHTRPDVERITVSFSSTRYDRRNRDVTYRTVRAIRRENPESIRDIAQYQDVIDFRTVEAILFRRANRCSNLDNDG